MNWLKSARAGLYECAAHRVRQIFCVFLAAAAVSASAQVTVVISDDSAPYREAATAFKENFAQGNKVLLGVDTLTVAALAAQRGPALAQSDLVVTVGVAAAQAIDAMPGHGPMLSILIPMQAFESLPCESPLTSARRCSAIFLDQPLRRQFNLIQAALPGKKRLALVLGPASARLLPALREDAANRKLTLATREIANFEELYPALQSVLPEADLLWALPDSVVLNPASARNVLVSAYRYQLPVVASSENYVKAGALVAVFSSPEQLGRQAAEIATIAIAGGKTALPPPQYPRYFSVRTNEQVARSLNIPIESEQDLHTRISGMRE